ncbi:hypothetical protein NPIL_37031 [Nephila pilipes]|uniref:Uncharacterized protein n=1 Tax=Nephila pilipes TaxID=299642 RepID=A0A8X6UAL6_NEPPI|nr:hypothetical protein NPIL_37031 [Nephila pilipes]
MMVWFCWRHENGMKHRWLVDDIKDQKNDLIRNITESIKWRGHREPHSTKKGREKGRLKSHRKLPGISSGKFEWSGMILKEKSIIDSINNSL